jgi:phosphatidylglycerophosphate synthase
MIQNYLGKLGSFLKKLDHYRDELLFLFIKRYWPRKITPNHLTYLRIAIGLLLTVLLLFFKIDDGILIISLFCLGVLTDLFDGSVSRALNKETEFGAMIDPLADRILILPIAIYSLYGPHKWLLFSIFLVEIISALITIFHESRQIHISANIFGKTRMVLLSLVFIAILIVWPKPPSEFFIDIIWISLIFSILSIFAKISELNNIGAIKSKLVTREFKKPSIKL